MKIKRILSILLTLSMVLSLCSFTVAADDNTSVNLFKFTDGTNTMVAEQSGIATNGFSSSSNGVYMKDSTGTTYTSSVISSATETVDGVENTYGLIKYGYLLNNYKNKAYAKATAETPFSFAKWMTNNPVLSFSGKFRIPEDNESGKNLNFYVGYAEGITTTKAGVKTFQSYVQLNAASKKIIPGCSATGFTGEKVGEDKTFEFGDWVTLDIRAYINENSNVVLGIYANDEIIYYATSTDTYSTLSLYDFSIRLSNPKVSTYAPFHVDELGLKALDVSKKPAIPVNPSSLAKEDLAAISLPATGATVCEDLTLPAVGSVNESKFTWISSNEDIIATNGTVTWPSEPTEVTLTVTADYEGTTESKNYIYTVCTPAYADVELIDLPASGSTISAASLTLPSTGALGSNFTWTSSDVNIIGLDGAITWPSTPTKVTLTVTADYKGETATKSYSYTVCSPMRADLNAIDMEPYGRETANMTLPTKGTVYGSTITWTSSNESVIAADGTVTKPSVTTEVKLTATATLDGKSEQKVFFRTVNPDGEISILKYTFEGLSKDTAINHVAGQTKAVVGSSGSIDFDFNIGMSTKEPFKGKVTAIGSNDSIPAKEGTSVFISTNADGPVGRDVNLLTNVSKTVTSYISADSETVLVSSYDIYIPEESKDSARTYDFQLRGDYNKDTEQYIYLKSSINGGKLNFSCSKSSIDCAERKETVEFTTDAWHTVEHIVKITPKTSGEGYDIKVYGVLDDECYYENEYTTSTNVFFFYKNDISIHGTGKGLSNIVTGYDNINVTKFSNYVDTFTSGFASNDNYVYPLAVNYDDSTITAKGRVVNKGVNHCLVLAVYDASGKLLTLKPSTTFDDDGLMTVDVTNASYVAPGYKFKAFMFDSLTTIIPQVAAKEVTVPAAE